MDEWMEGRMDEWMMGGRVDDGWMNRLRDKWMGDNIWDKDPSVTGQLTIDPQAILQLCAAGHVGRHTAVAPSIRKPGSLNEKNSPICGYRHSLPGRDRLVALEPGDIWKKEERCKGPGQPIRLYLCHGHPRGASRVATWGAFISATGESQRSPGGWGRTGQCCQMEPTAQRDVGWGNQEQGESVPGQPRHLLPCQKTSHKGDVWRRTWYILTQQPPKDGPTTCSASLHVARARPRMGFPQGRGQRAQEPRQSRVDLVQAGNRKGTLFPGASCLPSTRTQPQLPAPSSTAGLERIPRRTATGRSWFLPPASTRATPPCCKLSRNPAGVSQTPVQRPW